MNKVVTINLNGRAYQLEEDAYAALRAYLDKAERALGANPDKDEIIKDLEQAIAVKCDAYLHAHKSVLSLSEVDSVITEMGPVAEDGEEPKAGAEGDPNTAWLHKRLYKIRDGKVLAGVCNGLAVYFNVDVTLVRILFVLFAFFSHGFGVGVYIVLALVIPTARTSKDYDLATGVPPVTAQILIDRAKEGYKQILEDAPKWQAWGEQWKHQHKQWKHAERNRYKAEMRRIRYEGRHQHSVVSELFGIACATVALTFAGWFLYGHVPLVHDFFTAVHSAWDQGFNAVYQAIESNNQ